MLSQGQEALRGPGFATSVASSCRSFLWVPGEAGDGDMACVSETGELTHTKPNLWDGGPPGPTGSTPVVEQNVTGPEGEVAAGSRGEQSGGSPGVEGQDIRAAGGPWGPGKCPGSGQYRCSDLWVPQVGDTVISKQPFAEQ